ncbi:unnamed protein product, partial [Prorocentrum cordatum]
GIGCEWCWANGQADATSDPASLPSGRTPSRPPPRCPSFLEPSSGAAAVRSHCGSRCGMFVDPHFPPDDSSLGAGLAQEGQGRAEWRRPEEALGAPALFTGGCGPRGWPAAPGNVVQGGLDDCWLISAISLLAQRGGLLRALFPGGAPSGGACRVRLFMDGSWEELVIDTLLPCVHGELLFARPGDGSETYACFLEKAFAKAYGGYQALSGGSVGEALLTLTGAPVDDMNLSRLRPEQLRGELWSLLRRHFRAGDLVACGLVSTCNERTARHRRRGGLSPNHAYSVVDVAEVEIAADQAPAQLVRVLNTWGRFEWTGSWSSGSDEWARLLPEELRHSEGGAGAFWMELADFARHFNRLHICRVGVPQRGPRSQKRFEVETSPPSCGGCSNFGSFFRNPMFRVLPARAVEVSVTVIQPDARRELREAGARLTYPQVGVTLLAQHFESRVATDQECCTPDRWRVLQKTAFWNKRDVSMVFQADPMPGGQEYRVVPSRYYPGDPGMGRFVVVVSWWGPDSAVLVEPITTAARSTATLRGTFEAEQGAGDDLSVGAAYRVTAREAVAAVPVSVLLTRSPERLQEWPRQDPLHDALGRLFHRFDANRSGCLEADEMAALLDAVAGDGAGLGRDSSQALFRQFDRAHRGGVALAQLIAQSSALVPLAGSGRLDLLRRVEQLAGPRAAERLGDETPRGDQGLSVAVTISPCCAAECLRARPVSGSCCEGEALRWRDADVWSASFLVQSREFLVRPFAKGRGGCSYELSVLSSLEGVGVQPVA